MDNEKWRLRGRWCGKSAKTEVFCVETFSSLEEAKKRMITLLKEKLGIEELDKAYGCSISFGSRWIMATCPGKPNLELSVCSSERFKQMFKIDV